MQPEENEYGMVSIFHPIEPYWTPRDASFNPRNHNFIRSPSDLFKKLDGYVVTGEVSNDDSMWPQF